MKTKKKKLIVLSSLLILSSFVLYSCYPDYGLTTSDYDTVITVFDNTANFKKLTYAMPDTVLHFVEEGEEDNIDTSKDELIKKTIRDNMTRLNYVKIDTTDPNPPDFVILVGVTTTDNYGTVWYPGWGYWGGWGGWWGSYPGWGYPGGSVTYSYTTGTIFMTMLEPDTTDPNDITFKAIWLARLNGVISNSSTINVSNRITTRINDAFNQSPYLGAN